MQRLEGTMRQIQLGSQMFMTSADIAKRASLYSAKNHQGQLHFLDESRSLSGGEGVNEFYVDKLISVIRLSNLCSTFWYSFPPWDLTANVFKFPHKVTVKKPGAPDTNQLLITL